jgi:sterol desaturase/sphingolipid hydroxylase (fatty acid hydroxylase superfamily)
VLNWVFSTADLHRWHHSADFAESNTNFGSNLILWDIVFRTRYLPEGRPQRVGIVGLTMPDNFFAHLASPFVLRRLQEDPARAK